MHHYLRVDAIKIYKKQSLFSTFIGCDYRTQSSSLSFEEKSFSLEMVKNDICLGSASKQNTLFFPENVP